MIGQYPGSSVTGGTAERSWSGTGVCHRRMSIDVIGDRPDRCRGAVRSLADGARRELGARIDATTAELRREIGGRIDAVNARDRCRPAGGAPAVEVNLPRSTQPAPRPGARLAEPRQRRCADGARRGIGVAVTERKSAAVEPEQFAPRSDGASYSGPCYDFSQDPETRRCGRS